MFWKTKEEIDDPVILKLGRTEYKIHSLNKSDLTPIDLMWLVLIESNPKRFYEFMDRNNFQLKNIQTLSAIKYYLKIK